MRRQEIADYRAGLADRIQLIDPNLFLTFNFNPPQGGISETSRFISEGWQLTADAARKKMDTFFCMLLRYTHGRGWYRDPAVLRPLAFGFLENPKSNFHYHVLAKLSDPMLNAIINRSESAWFKLCPGGQLDWRPIDNLDGAVRYVTKRFYSEAEVEAMYVFSDPNCGRGRRGK